MKTSQLIDGKAISAKVRQTVASEVLKLKAMGISPALTVVIVGDNPASVSYVKSKEKACKDVGIESVSIKLPESTTEDELLSKISRLNDDPRVHGILVQLPLPKHINPEKVISAISVSKDVDGFHPINVGKLALGEDSFVPCTPAGIMALIESTGTDLTGKHAVVVGRSNIVGKPVAVMLLAKHATVTVCHSKTPDLKDEISRADVVVAAIGKPLFIKGDWIKKGAIVIDVGINRTPDGKIVGDVDFEAAAKRAGAITPVPGGVGPMTIAMLLKNTVKAATKGK